MGNDEEELLEGEPPTREPTRKIDVHIIKNGEGEEGKSERLLKEIALIEWDKHIEKLVEEYPSYEEVIRETDPTQIEKLEIEMLKDAHKTGRRVSSGVVGLKQGGSDDPVDAVFTGEYDSQLDMINALKKLKLNKNLTPEQHRRILNTEDELWAKLRDKELVNATIKEKSIYDGKNVFLVKCPVCFEEVPQRDYNVHIETHQNNPIKKLSEEMQKYRGR